MAEIKITVKKSASPKRIPDPIQEPKKEIAIKKIVAGSLILIIFFVIIIFWINFLAKKEFKNIKRSNNLFKGFNEAIFQIKKSGQETFKTIQEQIGEVLGSEDRAPASQKSISPEEINVLKKKILENYEKEKY